MYEDYRSLSFAKDICDVFLEPSETNDVLAPKRGSEIIGHCEADATCLGLTRFNSQVI